MRSALATFGLAAFLLLLACGASGCGSSDRPYVAPTLPVKGKITYNGKPLTQGNITFEPVGFGRDASGGIQPDGTFVLTTFKDGDGAVAGVHRVAVTDTGRVVLPARYRSLSSSKVEVEVVEGKSEYAIDLK